MTPPLPAPPADDPDRRTVHVPWAGKRAVLDVVVIYVGAQLLVGIVATLAGLGGNGIESLLPVLIVLSPVVSLVFAVGWLWLRYRGGLRAVRGRRRLSLADVGVGLGFGIVCFLGQRLIVLVIAAILTSAGLEMPVVQETFQEIVQRPGGATVLALTSVMLAPVAEEVVFRGVLFQGLRARTGFWLAALVSAVLFTLAHLGEGGGWLSSAILVAGILPLGVAFAAVVERRGSLLASISAHAMYNAINVTLLIVTVG